MVDMQGDQVQFLLGDFNTRLRDIDERNKLVRERVLLLGKNFLNSRQEIDTVIDEIKKENIHLKREVEKLKRLAENLLVESNRSVKQEEVMIIERMLKDFQPLDFMRRKDVEELIEKKLAKENSPMIQKGIKTGGIFKKE